MDLKLHGKSALVSGSTAGIGFAIARGLAQEGASVIITGRSSERVEEAIALLCPEGSFPNCPPPEQSSGQSRSATLGHRARYANASLAQTNPEAKVSGVVADLAKKEGAQQVFQQVPHIDILVNNLGVYEPKAFSDITDEDWLDIFEANVLSGVRLSRHYLPKMLEQNWGRIIFISSESAIQIPVEMIHYGMTKTAQLAIARGLAQSTVGTQVTVNSVLAGPTRSEGVDDFVAKIAKDRGISPSEVEADFFKNVRPTSLIKRFATTDEVAAMVVYLSSPIASATNGAALRVDGGVVQSVV